MNTPAIAIRNLSKFYPAPLRGPSLRTSRIVAVDNLSLEVRPGEVYGLLGPNGSGKSTAMKVVLGLVPPSSGSTEIFGRDSRTVPARESVGYLPENPYFYKFLTGEETVRFFGRLCGLRGKPLRDRAAELLALVRLEEARNRRLAGYSKGMLQRIGLAQALIGDPRLLVLDEPTAGVDPAGSREIRDLILDLKSRGITVLLCSHLLEQVQEICDRVGILHRGRLLREGPLDQLISIENQTEVLLENASPDLLAEVAALARARGASYVADRQPRRTLERFFLEVTSQDPPKPSP
jgi:ABC-2 type transport system ATP-binding protein